MNCLFIVQGEGRGHMTQALSLAGILRRAGHHVSSVLVGRSRRREVPGFFVRKIGAPVTSFDSPNFVADAKSRSVRLAPSLWQTACNARRYLDSLRVIDAHLARHRPDLVINFFEPLAGLYYARHRPAVPMVCIGHQYLAGHAAFPFPAGRSLERWMMKRFADLTAIGAARRLALSFTPLPDRPAEKLSVMPPLLRDDVFERPNVRREPFLLAYMVNSGYADEIMQWHARHPSVVVHGFWDHREAPETYSPAPNLTFHRLDDELFLALMARCRGLVSTAGFESICEAMYLGKPVLMVPVEGHYEQQCNALDAVRAGAGITAPAFDLDRFLAYLDAGETPPESFRPWAEAAPDLFLAELEAIAGMPPLRVDDTAEVTAV